MDSPTSYHKANQFQRRDSLEIIKDYFPKFKWRLDYQDSLIDIGSGPGDVLFDFVYPKMPRDFRRIVCSDLNPNMVEYAKNNYGHLEKIQFTTLNIESKNELAKDLKGQFDHVTSFNVLHWTKDLRSPKKDLSIILNDVGFSEYEIHIKHKVFDYDNEEIFQENMNGVNPFLKFIPAESHQEFRRAFVDTAISLGFKDTTNGLSSNDITRTYVKSLNDQISLELVEVKDKISRMNQPALYHKSHSKIKSTVGDIFREYSSKIQWRKDGCDTVLDIGSGPGDVLADYILPLIPTRHGKIVCSDKSKEMIDYAQQYMKNLDRIEFEILDIATKKPLSPELREQMDHVISILCLHWIQDLRTATRNIFQLLRPEGGDCLLIFMADHAIFDAYNYISHFNKWSEYVKDVHRFISSLHFSVDPKAEFTEIMIEAGFSNITVELKKKIFNYGDLDNLKENVKSVCGLLNAIPVSLHSEFLDDFVTIMCEFGTRNGYLSHSNSKYNLQYNLIVAYGQKLPMNRIKAVEGPSETV
ncbi:juvenile hormone acid O-methyltransferase-like [Haematobia irritans]|uniref:juvenile hormone acid O-methyltransferase-like n=1 Tax=Haematobia irritans TaxID=7368 RepID=UPI003F509F73